MSIALWVVLALVYVGGVLGGTLTDWPKTRRSRGLVAFAAVLWPFAIVLLALVIGGVIGAGVVGGLRNLAGHMRPKAPIPRGYDYNGPQPPERKT